MAMPAHCLIEGYFAETEGKIGGPYRIGFRMRMPIGWNGKFLFQGGGGSNGVVGDALGFAGVGSTPALMRGYAVIAQDSGHDNARNTRASHGGELVFGHDPVARANYGHASLKQTYDLAQYLIIAHYARKSETNMFWGCSKGGQEGMAFAQRYPDAFDGIVASAPGFSLPKAALTQAWDTQQFAGILRANGETPSIASLKKSFSPAQFGLAREASLTACDALDGTKDGMVNAIGQCTTARVLPELKARQCQAGQSADCLSSAQIDALTAVMSGPKNSKGEALYADWPWDGGIGTPGWNVWKIGAENGPPALNVVLESDSKLSALISCSCDAACEELD
jgi:feruloyl esterase